MGQQTTIGQLSAAVGATVLFGTFGLVPAVLVGLAAYRILVRRRNRRQLVRRLQQITPHD